MIAAGPLAEAALGLAQRWNRSLYDSLYVALALREECRLVTADRPLFNAFEGGPLDGLLVWIEQV